MDTLQWLIDNVFNAHITLAGGEVVMWREVVGNVFGLASAIGGMRRKIWAWPVGIIGNLLLLTVFLGSLLDPASTLPHLLGQAGRQIMFITVSIYGWVRWKQSKDEVGTAVVPDWTSGRVRLGMVLFLLIGTVALTPLFAALGSYAPVWADAWTFVGSLLATFGMAKGWTEFWLVWVAVDIVGVPLLFSAGYYATAGMYAFYGAFTLIGFFVWRRAREKDRAAGLVVDRPTTRIDRLATTLAVGVLVALAGFYVGHLVPATGSVPFIVGVVAAVAVVAVGTVRAVRTTALTPAVDAEPAPPVTTV